MGGVGGSERDKEVRGRKAIERERKRRGGVVGRERKRYIERR